jgi:cytidylate kinase
VRQACVAVQQEIAKQDNVIMDGRDIGTIVLPQANYKFFLTASIETRAQRRYKDNIERGIKSDLDILRQKIKERDLFDSTRKHSPLKPAEDAVIIDTSDLTIDEVVEVIINKLEEVDKNGI